MSERWVMVQPAVGAARLAGVADSPIPVRADRVDRVLGSSTGVVDLAGVCDEIGRFVDEQPDRAERLTPSMVRLSQLAVDDAIEREDWFEAVRLARRGRAWDPTDLRSNVLLGHALHGRGLHDDAVHAWLEAIELAREQNRRSPMLWLLSARALHESGRSDEAVVLLDELLELGEHTETRQLRDSIAREERAAALDQGCAGHDEPAPDDERRRPPILWALLGLGLAVVVVMLAVGFPGGDDQAPPADSAPAPSEPVSVTSSIAPVATEVPTTQTATSAVTSVPAATPSVPATSPPTPTTLSTTTVPTTEPPPPPVPAVSVIDGVRLFDSRNDVGRRGADEVTVIEVAGRGGIPADAQGAVLTIAALAPDSAGFITAYPCDTARPTAAALLYGAGLSASGGVTTAVGADGTVCLYTSAGVDLIVDTTAFIGPNSGFETLIPARLLDTRVGGSTVDGRDAGLGRRVEGQVTVAAVSGRGGVPVDAQAAVLTIAALTPDAAGFVTAYPCDQDRPNATAVLFGAGTNASGSLTTAVGADGTVCLYTSAAVGLVIDVTAVVRLDSEFQAVAPARLVDTRAGGSTVDGTAAGVGRLAAEQVAVFTIAGRGGVPDDARTVEFVVSALAPDSGGFITAYACDRVRPATSSLVFNAGQSAGSTVTTGVAADGTVCVYSTAAVDVIVDVTAAD